MPQKMIVALNVGTREQRDAITLHLNAKGWRWWHFYADLWLLADVPDAITPQVLWREFDRLPPLNGKSILITTVPDDAMSFFGVAVPEAWSWMSNNWGDADLLPRVAAPAEPAVSA